MSETMRFAIQGACVSVFVVTLAVAGVRMQSRLLLALRYGEVRDTSYPLLTLSPPRLRGFVLRPLLAVLAIGGPALAAYFLVRGARGWPSVVPALLWIAVWPLIAGVLLWRSSSSPWAGVHRALTKALAMPADRRDELLPDAFAEDPQLQAALADR